MAKNRQAEISRVNRTKEEAQAAYNRLSRVYDLLAGSSEKPYREEGLKMLSVQPGEVVLEIGYGTGHALVELARAVGAQGEVYGIDISPGMWEISRERVAQSGMANRVALEVGDAAQLPFTTDFFDAVFMSFTLELFDTPEIPQVLAECRRALKNGGRLGAVSLVKKDHDSLPVRLYEWAHRQFPSFVDCRPIYLEEAIRAAGFTIQGVKIRNMWGLPVAIVVGSA